MKKLVLLPAVLAVGLAGCAQNGVQPGYVNGSSNGGGYQNASASGPVTSMGTGRVVSINEVQLAGSGGGGGMSNGTMSGGLIGGAGGAALGAVIGRGSLPGILIGGLLGAVGGGIAGHAYDGHRGGGRGIEVTVQREDGATMTVAQRDDGDVQLGDRVEIVQDGNGVKKVVRDNSRAPDSGPPPYVQNNGPQYGGPPPDMQGSNQQYVPRDQGYPSQGYPSSQDGQSYTQSRYTPRPQDDPRYGNLD